VGEEIDNGNLMSEAPVMKGEVGQVGCDRFLETDGTGVGDDGGQGRDEALGQGVDVVQGIIVRSQAMLHVPQAMVGGVDSLAAANDA
jgi:hypothetical protein